MSSMGDGDPHQLPCPPSSRLLTTTSRSMSRASWAWQRYQPDSSGALSPKKCGSCSPSRGGSQGGLVRGLLPKQAPKAGHDHRFSCVGRPNVMPPWPRSCQRPAWTRPPIYLPTFAPSCGQPTTLRAWPGPLTTWPFGAGQPVRAPLSGG